MLSNKRDFVSIGLKFKTLITDEKIFITLQQPRDTIILQTNKMGSQI